MNLRRVSFLLLMSMTMMTGCDLSTELPDEGLIPVTGGSVWYKILGRDKPGIPLLVLHGGPGAPHDYLEPLETLAKERPVIFYDQLGCGNSERTTDTTLFTVERYVLELEQVRRALRLDQIHLFGQSWGTALAVLSMLDGHSSGVHTLILSAPYLSTPRWIADQRALIQQLPDSLQEAIAEAERTGQFDTPAYQTAMNAYYVAHLCRMDPWPEYIQRAFAKMGTAVYSHMWGPSEFTSTGTLKNLDLTDRLREITIPVLLTCGEFDEATPESTTFFSRQFPNAELAVIPQSSHMHHAEAPTEFFRVLRAFLNRHEHRSR